MKELKSPLNPPFTKGGKQRIISSFILFIVFCFCVCGPGFPQTPAENKFLVLTLDNKIITPVIANYVSDGLKKARQESYSGLIIVMDTPGGLLESTRDIVKKILNSEIPVIVYIAPSGSRAGSAGVFITLASSIAAMAPSTNIGAAHPVMMGEDKKDDRPLKKAIEDLTDVLKKQPLKNKAKNKNTPAPEESAKPKEEKQGPGSVMEDKVLNDTLAWISGIAKTRNRNADWAREAVLKSASITEKEAQDMKVIDLIAVDLDDLLRKIDGRSIAIGDKTLILDTKDAELIYFDLPAAQNILNTLIEPNIAYILMLIGLLGLFIEITHPGVIFPGIAGVICLIMAGFAFAMLPVNFAGLSLIVFGIVLFIAEALTPLTFGLLTLAGIISMLLGSLMLVDYPFAGMSVSLSVILPFILSSAFIVILLTANVLRAHRKKTSSGPQALIGQTGIAQTDIIGKGQVFVAGEIWSAVNPSEKPVKKGEKIKVLAVDKVKLIVTKC